MVDALKSAFKVTSTIHNNPRNINTKRNWLSPIPKRAISLLIKAGICGDQLRQKCKIFNIYAKIHWLKSRFAGHAKRLNESLFDQENLNRPEGERHADYNCNCLNTVVSGASFSSGESAACKCEQVVQVLVIVAVCLNHHTYTKVERSVLPERCEES